MGKKKKQVGHWKGIGCDPWYAKQREARKCSCGRPGIGLTDSGSPVCEFHDRFPTKKVRNFPPIVPCPGPHTETNA